MKSRKICMKYFKKIVRALKQLIWTDSVGKTNQVFITQFMIVSLFQGQQPFPGLEKWHDQLANHFDYFLLLPIRYKFRNRQRQFWSKLGRNHYQQEFLVSFIITDVYCIHTTSFFSSRFRLVVYTNFGF